MTTILSILLVYTVLQLLPLAQAQNQACPIEPPDASSSCIADGFVQGQVCRYDYIDVSCPPESMLCVPITYYNCDATVGWRMTQANIGCPAGIAEGSTFGQPCDPSQTNKPPIGVYKLCPNSPPSGKCLTDGYADGLSCNYDYRDVSCDETIQQCVPQEYYTCDGDSDEWILSVPDVFCENETPPTFLESCNPCPTTKPRRSAVGGAGVDSCTEDFRLGFQCGYEYQDVSCEADGIEMCRPTELFTCSKTGWTFSAPRLGCAGAGKPEGFGTPCGPDAITENPTMSPTMSPTNTPTNSPTVTPQTTAPVEVGEDVVEETKTSEQSAASHQRKAAFMVVSLMGTLTCMLA